MYISNRRSCGQGGSWDTYSADNLDWLLQQMTGTVTVYSNFVMPAAMRRAALARIEVSEQVHIIAHDFLSTPAATDFYPHASGTQAQLTFRLIPAIL